MPPTAPTAPAAGSDILPRSLPPRGLSRVEAARYIGVSPTTFDKMVQAATMPAAKAIGARRVWDRKELDLFFEAIPNGAADSENPWD